MRKGKQTLRIDQYVAGLPETAIESLGKGRDGAACESPTLSCSPLAALVVGVGHARRGRAGARARPPATRGPGGDAAHQRRGHLRRVRHQRDRQRRRSTTVAGDLTDEGYQVKRTPTRPKAPASRGGATLGELRRHGEAGQRHRDQRPRLRPDGLAADAAPAAARASSDTTTRTRSTRSTTIEACSDHRPADRAGRVVPHDGRTRTAARQQVHRPGIPGAMARPNRSWSPPPLRSAHGDKVPVDEDGVPHPSWAVHGLRCS